LVRKPEGKSSFKRPRHRWDDNIKINLWKVWRVCTRFIWVRTVTSSCKQGNKPSGSIQNWNLLTP
jgi:hypothetical protein